MKKIDKETVQKIADLAKLDLSEEELDNYSEQIEDILEYVDQLEELDTENVEPLSHVHDITNALREDEVEETDQRQKHLDNAPAKKGPYFKVPQVIEDDS